MLLLLLVVPLHPFNPPVLSQMAVVVVGQQILRLLVQQLHLVLGGLVVVAVAFGLVLAQGRVRQELAHKEMPEVVAAIILVLVGVQLVVVVVVLALRVLTRHLPLLEALAATVLHLLFPAHLLLMLVAVAVALVNRQAEPQVLVALVAAVKAAVTGHLLTLPLLAQRTEVVAVVVVVLAPA